MNSCGFWDNKRVLVTGHTGFKGSWLTLWLQKLNAEVIGFSEDIPTDPSLYKLAEVDKGMKSYNGDIRDIDALCEVIHKHRPEVIFHLAAQPLVRKSYRFPVETFDINVMGTVNVLEAARIADSVRVIVNITTDKCYENKEWVWGYRESDALGGYDPYSASKACSELVTEAYSRSYFDQEHVVGVATARAGNVIGGGDWAEDRLIPDMMRAILNKEQVFIRNPDAIRPWQHVIGPLHGYMVLAEKLWGEADRYKGAWNFGPPELDVMPVSSILKLVVDKWKGDIDLVTSENQVIGMHEAVQLKLDCSKANTYLGWKQQLSVNQAIEWSVDWYKAYSQGADMREFTYRQIEEYEQLLTCI